MTKDKKPFRILVIEDNAGDFVLVEDYLMEQILQPVIVHAVNFSESSALLMTGGTAFDVILLDLSLPDKNRQTLVTDILKIASECPVIVLTGYSDIDFSVQSITQGISDYLLKDDLNAASLYKSIVYCVERKKQLLELKESEKRYSNLFHLSPQPMWVYDADTRNFVQVNKAAAELYGYSEKEFLSMSITDLWPQGEGPKEKELAGKIVEEMGPLFKGRFRHQKKSEEPVDVEIYSNPILLNDKKYLSVIAIDVSEKIQFDHRLTRAIIKTQEDERYEIGAELHDNVCQLLATSQLSLGLLRKSLPDAVTESYNNCRKYITLATEEIRNLSHRLAPAFFNDTTLEESFEILLGTFNMEKKYKISLYFDNSIIKSGLERDLQLNLYRILQEQLRNISKYAKATTIKVEVVLHIHKLVMRIADNGVGFDIDRVKKGIGLANMKRRSELFFGCLEINSSPGKGCEIVVEIPMTEIAQPL